MTKEAAVQCQKLLKTNMDHEQIKMLLMSEEGLQSYY